MVLCPLCIPMMTLLCLTTMIRSSAECPSRSWSATALCFYIGKHGHLSKIPGQALEFGACAHLLAHACVRLMSQQVASRRLIEPDLPCPQRCCMACMVQIQGSHLCRIGCIPTCITNSSQQDSCTCLLMQTAERHAQLFMVQQYSCMMVLTIGLLGVAQSRETHHLAAASMSEGNKGVKQEKWGTNRCVHLAGPLLAVNPLHEGLSRWMYRNCPCSTTCR